MFWHIALTLLARALLADSLFQTDIIRAFFEKYAINRGVLLNCLNKKEQISVLQHFIPTTTVMSSSTNLSKIDFINLLYMRHGRMGVVLDGDCADSKRIITLCGRHRFFDVKYYWLIFAETGFDHLFSEADFNIDSNIHTVSPSRSMQFFQIYDFYNPSSKRGGHIVKTEIGTFSNSTGYRFSDNNNKFWQRRNLTGIVFNTTLVLHEPYSGTVEDYLQSNDHREYNTYNRFHARLIKYCKEHYDFSLNTNVTTLFGYQKGDGTMDGLAGDLERRISDFGLSPLFVRADRASVVTFGRLTYTIRSAFVFRNPKSKTMSELFLRPLSPSVWYCFLGFCILTCLIIRAIKNVDNDGDLSWSHSVLCIIGIISQQGLIIAPSTISGRVAMLFALILTYFVYLFYSGSLVSSLLNIPLVQIETVDDMLNANFKVGIQNNRFNREYFKYTVDNASIKLYKSVIMGNENQAYLSVIRGLNKIKAGRYAFHVEMAKAYPFIKNHFKEGICEISEVPMYESPKCYANYAKHSPFRDIMDVCLHRIAESGVMQKENTFWHTKKPECWYDFRVNTGVEEVYPVVASMIIGLLISVMILVVEIGRRKILRA